MSAGAPEGYSAAAGELAGAPILEIVADGGARLGFGHLGRCLAVWERLGDRAFFRVEERLAAAFLEAHGVEPPPRGGAQPPPLVLIDRGGPTDAEEVRALQDDGRKVALLDDLGSGRDAADLVIDPPTCAAWPAAAGARLEGFEYALLRRDVREAAAPTAMAAEPGTPSDGFVLVAMGGSDPDGLTVPLAAALRAAGLAVVAALGPGYQGARPCGEVVAPERFPALLARSDLLIAGYGHTLLEAAHLGVPAISAVSRREQLPHAWAFARAGTARVLDVTDGSRFGEVAAAAAGLLGDVGARARMAARGRELVDGAGAERVAQALRALAAGPAV